MKYKLTLTAAALLAAATVTSWAYQAGNVAIHGFFDQGYMASDENNYFGPTKSGTFHFTEAALNASTNVNDKLRVGGQLYTFRLGEINGMDHPVVDWLYADYQWKDWMGFRVGKIKMPNGIYGESLDLEMTRPYVFLPQSVYEAKQRDIAGALLGASVYGNAGLKKAGSIDYTAAFGKLDVKGHSGAVVDFSQGGPIAYDQARNDYMGMAQVIWNTPVKGLRLAASDAYIHKIRLDGNFKTSAEVALLSSPANALSGLATLLGQANSNTIINDMSYAVVGAEYLWKEWTFASEYRHVDGTAYNYVDSASASLAPGGALTGGAPTPIRNDGVYVAAARRISKDLELGGYYSLSYGNYNDRGGNDAEAEGNARYSAYQKDLAFAARYDVKPWWIVKAEVHFMDGTSGLMFNANQPISGQKETWTYGAVKTIFYF